MPRMRSVRVLRNVVTNYLRFFSGGLISFLLTPLMVHLLGDGGYGLWVTVFSLTGYFGLVDQGIRPSLVRYISRHRAAGDEDALARTISSAMALYSLAGVVTLGVTAVVALNFGHWFRVDPAMLADAQGAVALAGLSLALGFPLGVFGATLSGLQRYDLGNLIGIAIAVLRAIVFVIILRSGGGITELAAGSLVANLLGHVVTYFTVRRLLPALTMGRRWVDRATLAQIGSYSGFAFVGALANSLTFQTDSLVISAFLGAALVTPFALAAGLVDNVRTLVYSATWVLSPTASEMETLGETEKLQAMLIAGSRYSVLLAWPVLAALIIFGGALLSTWVGEKYREAGLLLTILAIPTLASLPQSAASSMLYGISRHKGVVGLSLVNALLNLGLSLWWVRPYGLPGVALANAVPLALVGGVATAVYASHAMQLSVRRYLWEGIGQPGVVCLAFVVPALLIERLWHPIGWLPLGLAVGGSWLVFAAAAWRWGVAPSERRRWADTIPRALGLARRTPLPETIT
jgi:O-antigen/teichoic acid export membrane protein